MRRSGRVVALLALAAVLAGCGWNPGFGTPGKSGAAPALGGNAQANSSGQAGPAPASGQKGNGQTAGGQTPGGQSGAYGNSNGQTVAPSTSKQTPDQAQAGGDQSSRPHGVEKINKLVTIRGDVVLQFDTATATSKLTLAGTERDQSPSRDLAQVDMRVTVWDAQGSYKMVGGMSRANYGTGPFRFEFDLPSNALYGIRLDAVRVLRSPLATVPLSNNSSLPSDGRVLDYRLDTTGWVVHLLAPHGVHYRTQLQYNDGKTYPATAEQMTSSSNSGDYWELVFANTPLEGRPTALQIPEYYRDYMDLNQILRG